MKTCASTLREFFSLLDDAPAGNAERNDGAMLSRRQAMLLQSLAHALHYACRRATGYDQRVCTHAPRVSPDAHEAAETVTDGTGDLDEITAERCQRAIHHQLFRATSDGDHLGSETYRAHIPE